MERFFLKLEKQKRYVFLTYTIFFLLLIGLSFFTFFVKGISFVWEGDGYSQHLKALMYIRKYWTEVFEKGFFIYDFHLGLGGNVFTTLTYYGFFEPLNFLSVLVPYRYTEYLYTFLVILRLYFAGLSFLYLCHHFGHKRIYSILGSMVYLSTSFVVFLSLKHPFFLNPMIYLPLFIVGIENILRNKKPYIFIFAVSFSALSGFYFLYMMTIMTFLYANIRFFEKFEKGHRIKAYCIVLGKSLGYYLLSLGLVSFMFIPHVLSFLQSNRLSKVESFYKVTDFYYFKNMLTLFYTMGKDLNFSISSILFFSLMIAFFKYYKERKAFLGLVILSIVGLGLPIVGSIMNGFSYPTNRWMFGTALILSYVFVDTLPEFFAIFEKKIVLVFLGFTNLIYVAFLFRHWSYPTLFGLIMIDLCYILITGYLHFLEPIGYKGIQYKISILSFLIMINAFLMGFTTHKIAGIVNRFTPYHNHKKILTSQEYQLKKSLKKDEGGIFRVSGSNFSSNTGLLTDLSTSNIYWSIYNANMGEFYEELALATENSKIAFGGFDGRSITSALASEKYFISSEKEVGEVPFGYKKIKKTKDGVIYKNTSFLPFGYTYDSYIRYEDLKNLHPLEKEATLLETIALSEDVSGMKKGKIRVGVKEKKITVSSVKNVIYNKGKEIDFIQSKEKQPEMKLSIDKNRNEEIYLFFRDFILNPKYSKSNIKLKGKDFNKNTLMRSPRSAAYFGRKDYLINLGSKGRKKKEISLSMGNSGKYKLKEMKAFSLDLSHYKAQVKKLKADVLEDVVVGNDRIKGKILLKNPKILTLSLPFEKDWKAYVNGKRVKLLKGNYFFSCLPLEAGEHFIELRYELVGGKLSLGLMVISYFTLFILFQFYRKRI